MTLFNCDGLITDRKCCVCFSEEVAINRIAVINDDFLEWRDRKLLELAKCKVFDTVEIPLVRKF